MFRTRLGRSPRFAESSRWHTKSARLRWSMALKQRRTCASTFGHWMPIFMRSPNIAGAIGLGAALDYLREIGIDEIAAYEHRLLLHGMSALSSVSGLRIIGTAAEKVAVLSFVIGDIDSADIGAMLDLQGIAVRTGHHCAQPVMTRFGLSGTIRASFAFYNTLTEIDALADRLGQITTMFQ